MPSMLTMKSCTVTIKQWRLWQCMEVDSLDANQP